MPDQEFDIIPNTSFLGNNDDDSYNNPTSSPDRPLSKQDVYEMTCYKIHSMNRLRRDAPLRKSVLIFNLLRGLHRDNAYDFFCDVEMNNGDDCTEESSTIDQEQQDGDNIVEDDEEQQRDRPASVPRHFDVDDENNEENEEDDEEMIDDDLTDESDTSDSSTSSFDAAENQSAVTSLAMIDPISEQATAVVNHLTFQFSPVTESSSWNSISTTTMICSSEFSSSEAMDVDQERISNEMTFIDHDVITSNRHAYHRPTSNNNSSMSTDGGLISESFRLLESGGGGGGIGGDQNIQFGSITTFNSPTTPIGEYRPFDSPGFNLFA